jgi:hypothetical protein
MTEGLLSRSRHDALSCCTARRGHLHLWRDHHAGEVLLHPEHGGRQPCNSSDRMHRTGYMGHPESWSRGFTMNHAVARTLSIVCRDLKVVVMLGICSGGLAHFELWHVAPACKSCLEMDDLTEAQRHVPCVRRLGHAYSHPCKHEHIDVLVPTTSSGLLRRCDHAA